MRRNEHPDGEAVCRCGPVGAGSEIHFELNPAHPLVKRAADTQDDAQFGEWVELLLDQALLAEAARWKIRTSLSAV
jgi:HSP90 family molecular chaperone